MSEFFGLKLLKSGGEKIKKNALWFQNLIMKIYPYIITVIVLSCIFLSKIEYAHKVLCENYLPPLVLIPFGFVFLLGIYALINCADLKQDGKSIVIISIGLFLLQLFFVYNYYFYTDWDVDWLIKFSDLYTHHQDVNDYKWYFSRYPNNLFLAWLFSLIRLLAHNIGLHSHEYFLILSVQCFFNTITGYLLFGIIKNLFKDIHFAFFGYVIYVLLVGISPWVSIPYSDSMALIFPSLIVYIYICKDDSNSMIMSFLIGVCSVVGYKIKPQVFIVFIAIVLVEIFKSTNADELKKNLTNNLISVFGILIGFLAIKIGLSTIHLPIDDNMSFGMAHFFMMGMNPIDMGVYSSNDIEFSATFSTCAERNAANLYEAFNRIKNMQVLGFGKLLVRKTLTNYYNGTFSWGGEGVFFLEIFNPKNTPICNFLRGLYYTNQYADIGKYYNVFSNFEQMMWLTIISLNIFSGNTPKNNSKCVIMLSILGLTVFELLFEARARYLLTYVPLYIILATYGFECIISKINVLGQKSFKSTYSKD